MKEAKNSDRNAVKELVFKVKDGDDSAFAELCELYSPMISSMTRSFSESFRQYGAEAEDVNQEALVAFYNSVLSFDSDKDFITFGLYAKICVKNRLISYSRKLKKNHGDYREYSDKKMHSSQRIFEIPDDFDNVLSEYELRVFDLYSKGMSYRQIAASLQKSEKAIDNAIFRIRSKIRRI